MSDEPLRSCSTHSLTMAFPFFFEEQLPGGPSFHLNEDTSRHVIQVLRMQRGEKISLTNGKGQVLIVEISTTDKKSVRVNLLSSSVASPPANKIAIAISLLKNENRFEWFLEKTTEVGVTEIIPVICERTEKQHFRYDRMKKIMISAMLQSQQAWLPVLHSPLMFGEVITRSGYDRKLIAHCSNDEKTSLKDMRKGGGNTIILVGPEGDFTTKEISLSQEQNFTPVSMGNHRLRTETAGVYAAIVLQ